MISAHTPSSLIAFETRIREKWEAGDLPCLLHLCGGNEAELIKIFRGIEPGDWVFSTHRNHYHALLKGISEERLEALIHFGRSMFVFDRTKNFFSSSILAGTCAIAAGVAWENRQEFLRTAPPPPAAHEGYPVERREPHVWCFLGDGAEEQGHFYEAVQFVAGHGLACTFIIEDNDRQVDTPKYERRGYHYDIWHKNIILPGCVRRYHYLAKYPHAGSGCAKKIVFNPAAIERMKAGSVAGSEHHDIKFPA